MFCLNLPIEGETMWGKIKAILGVIIGAVIFILYVLYGKERRKRVELQHKLKAQKVKAEMDKKRLEMVKKKALIDKNKVIYLQVNKKIKEVDKKIADIDKKLEGLKKRKPPKDTNEEWKKYGF